MNPSFMACVPRVLDDEVALELDLTQAEIGERIGVSQMQVSRILRHSIARLRTLAEPRS